MGNISRDSFKETQNTLNDLRSLVSPAQQKPRHYVSIRLQQGVPVLDADWNEQEDIRRVELEMVLARAVGNGVPAGSDGFHILEANPNADNLLIRAGLLFLDGWLVYNGSDVDYLHQPHRSSSGVAPALPPTLDIAPLAGKKLVYLDAWEREVDSEEDDNLVDDRIGIETCVRLERAWVVRMEPLAAGADPFDPAVIPNQQPRHRYYPLALLTRDSSHQITAGMITDLRRTHLTLDALTHTPLLIDDPVRGQQLDSHRLALMFRSTLDTLRDLLARQPSVFVFTNNPNETMQAMNALQDVRSAATSGEHLALGELLHRAFAFTVMRSFFNVQKAMKALLKGFFDAGIAPAGTKQVVDIYTKHLEGASASDSSSMVYALNAVDLLGAVLAQERLNETLALQGDTLPEGTVTANLISITPSGPLAANTTYELTVRIQSNLTSVQGSEPIRASVTPKAGWSLSFIAPPQPVLAERVVSVTNQQSLDIVLYITAETGAADTTFELSVRPDRRQQLVYHHPPMTLALGQALLPGTGTVLATLNYQGPTLQPGNIAQVSRDVMSGGVKLPFGVTNLSTATEAYQVTVAAQGDATGWQAPNEPVLTPLAPGASRNIDIGFKITDKPGAASPLAYRLQLKRVTGGANDPLPYTAFTLTFQLQ